MRSRGHDGPNGTSPARASPVIASGRSPLRHTSIGMHRTADRRRSPSRSTSRPPSSRLSVRRARWHSVRPTARRRRAACDQHHAVERTPPTRLDSPPARSNGCPRAGHPCRHRSHAPAHNPVTVRSTRPTMQPTDRRGDCALRTRLTGRWNKRALVTGGSGFTGSYRAPIRRGATSSGRSQRGETRLAASPR